MAKNREMLKEAIAEAKAIKEMAIANAKQALEESFTPQLRSMLSQKINEMDEEEINENEEELQEIEDIQEDELDLNELLNDLNEADETEETEEETEAEPLDLENMTDEDLKEMIKDIMKELESEEGEEEEVEDETMEDEVDLAELLAEIELDENFDFSDYDEEEDLGDNDLEGLSTKKLNPETGELEDEFELEDDMMENEDINLEELLAEIDLDEEETVNEYAEEVEELRETVNKLRSELNEINLLNAKLLYSNKIFKAKNLTENQKLKVLSSFDKATTINETKLVYETLNEGLTVKKPLIKENLGSASKSTPILKTKQPIMEATGFERMLKLAGLD